MIITEEEIRFLKEVFNFDIDKHNREKILSDSKAFINTFYNRFGLDVLRKINEINFDAVMYSAFYESLLKDIKEKIKEFNDQRSVVIYEMSGIISGSKGAISKTNIENYNHFFNSEDNSFSDDACRVLYNANLLTIEEFHQFDIKSESGKREFFSYLRKNYKEGKYKKVDNTYIEFKKNYSSFEVNEKKYETLEKIYDNVSRRINQVFMPISISKSNDRIIIDDLNRVSNNLIPIIGKENVDYINETLTNNNVGGFFLPIYNIENGYTNVIFVKEDIYKNSTNYTRTIHEINHALESKILHENEDYYLASTGWDFVPGEKKIFASKSIDEQVAELSQSDLNLIYNYLDIKSNNIDELKSCILSGISLNAILFFLKNSDQVLSEDVSKIFLSGKIHALNEAINDYITYNIYKSVPGKAEYKRNEGYSSLFPMIEKFYELYEEDIIRSRHDGNISIILDKVGIDNFLALAELVSSYYRELHNNDSKEKNFDKRDVILQSMMDYSNQKKK